MGVTVNGASKAYPFDALVRHSPIIDDVGGIPILLVLGDDKRSVRAYERVVDGRKLEFFVKPHVAELSLADAETGSTWSFAGSAIKGALTGRQLKKVAVLNDYWFDWKAYHPQTAVYELGAR